MDPWFTAGEIIHLDSLRLEQIGPKGDQVEISSYVSGFKTY
jgi:hypothetical protein